MYIEVIFVYVKRSVELERSAIHYWCQNIKCEKERVWRPMTTLDPHGPNKMIEVRYATGVLYLK
jgi:hypothetical protein